MCLQDVNLPVRQREPLLPDREPVSQEWIDLRNALRRQSGMRLGVCLAGQNGKNEENRENYAPKSGEPPHHVIRLPHYVLDSADSYCGLSKRRAATRPKRGKKIRSEVRKAEQNLHTGLGRLKQTARRRPGSAAPRSEARTGRQLPRSGLLLVLWPWERNSTVGERYRYCL
jgi:hypothetical protein